MSMFFFIHTVRPFSLWHFLRGEQPCVDQEGYPRLEVVDADDEVAFPSEAEECLCDLSKTDFRCVCNANCLQHEENLKCLELVGPLFFLNDTETEFCLQQGHPTSPMELMQVCNATPLCRWVDNFGCEHENEINWEEYTIEEMLLLLDPSMVARVDQVRSRLLGRDDKWTSSAAFVAGWRQMLVSDGHRPLAPQILK